MLSFVRFLLGPRWQWYTIALAGSGAIGIAGSGTIALAGSGAIALTGSDTIALAGSGAIAFANSFCGGTTFLVQNIDFDLHCQFILESIPMRVATCRLSRA